MAMLEDRGQHSQAGDREGLRSESGPQVAQQELRCEVHDLTSLPHEVTTLLHIPVRDCTDQSHQSLTKEKPNTHCE
jgi:hypothetical protein